MAAQGRFLMAWIGVTVVTFVAAGAFSHFPGGASIGSSGGGIEPWAVGLAFGAVGGLLIAGAQWFVLRGQLQRAWRWVPLTVVAFAVIHAMRDGLPVGTPELPVAVLDGLLIGAVAWAVLEPRKAAGWTLAATLGWTVGLSAGLALSHAFGLDLGEGYAQNHMVIGGVTGALTAAATGVAWRWALDRAPART